MQVGDSVRVHGLTAVNEGEEEDVVVRFVSRGPISLLRGEEEVAVVADIRTRLMTAGLSMTTVQVGRYGT